MPTAYLVDTNVLLRATHSRIEQHLLCKQAIDALHSRNAALHFTLQNAAEFWNVATRPLTRNDYGRSPVEVSAAWQAIEQSMVLLPDDENVYKAWRTLAETHRIQGVQVHDARLAATMLTHRVPHILTLNTADCARFPGIQAVHPQEV